MTFGTTKSHGGPKSEVMHGCTYEAAWDTCITWVFAKTLYDLYFKLGACYLDIYKKECLASNSHDMSVDVRGLRLCKIGTVSASHDL